MKKLPFTTGDMSHWRWMTVGGGATLHRIRCFRRQEEIQFVGLENIRTVCGLSSNRVTMPGVFSRLQAPRCKTCCKRLGITYGEGCPYNEGIEEPECVE